jgi:hypothetical protein
VRALGGCDEEYKACYPGDFIACTCVSGALGYARCAPLGDYLTSVCVCDGKTPGVDGGRGDAGGDGSAEADGSACLADAGIEGDAEAGSRRPYFEPCTTNEDCASCLCERFAGSGRCTLPCTTLEQCPAPADACTSRNVCRPPS